MPIPAANIPTDKFAKAKPRLRQTRVLIVSDHPTESRDVASNLRRLELDVQLALFDGKTLSAIPKQAPDAVLCHLTDYAERGSHLAKVIRSHFCSRALPIIGAMSRPSPDASNEFDSTLFAPMHASQIANRVNAMIRLGVMENEITRRLETLAESFDEHPQIGDMTPDRRFRVLFIGKASPAFMVIINALQDKGVDVVAAFTSFSAFDYLHGDPFDAVVMNALEQTEPAFSISEAMRRNSKLFHTPTLFLIDKDVFQDHDAAYDRGARDIITVDAEPEEISGRILELANYHRVHEQLKSDIFALTSDSTRDRSGSAFSQAFMTAHLPRLLDDAKAANLPLALIGLTLTPVSTDPVEPKTIAAAYAQIASLIGNLVRMQDVVCRWDDETFVLAFYDTDQSQAERILTRIKALIDCSAYENSAGSTSALTFTAQSSILEISTDIRSAEVHLSDLIADLRENGSSA